MAGRRGRWATRGWARGRAPTVSVDRAVLNGTIGDGEGAGKVTLDGRFAAVGQDCPFRVRWF
eukprot:6406529-Pyramimonas_sp.AAC.1